MRRGFRTTSGSSSTLSWHVRGKLVEGMIDRAVCRRLTVLLFMLVGPMPYIRRCKIYNFMYWFVLCLCLSENMFRTSLNSDSNMIQNVPNIAHPCTLTRLEFYVVLACWNSPPAPPVIELPFKKFRFVYCPGICLGIWRRSGGCSGRCLRHMWEVLLWILRGV